jgi:hypothetical protein
VTVGGLMSVVAAVVVACGLAWRIAVGTGSALIAAVDPDAALNLNSSLRTALDAAAARQMTTENGNIELAEQSLQKALRASPLDQQALFLMAEAAGRQNDWSRADALMRMAGERSWRNIGVQLSLIESDLQKRRFDEALTHIDAALRLSPDLQYRDNHLLGVLAAFVLDAQALRSLEKFLGTAPPWREWFLQELSKRLVKPAPLDAIFASLASSSNPPTHPERLAYVGRLVRDRRYVEAQRQWAAELPGGLGLRPSYPYNRDFKTVPDHFPFDWQILARHGAEVRLRPADDKSPGLLVAQFSGSRVEITVRQLLILHPGRYVFAGDLMAQDLRASRGVQWRLFCADAVATTLGETELVASSMPWTRFTVQFEVPRHGCAAEWLQMDIPARVPAEREIEGQVSYRSLTIDPVDAGSGLQLLWRWSN